MRSAAFILACCFFAHVASSRCVSETVREVVQGTDITTGCLKKQGDRFQIEKRSPFPRGDLDDVVLVASDLCAMGHTTKEPAHFTAFLLDRYCSEPFQNRTVALTLLYANQCMTRERNKGGNKRSGVFWGVLRGWFRAIFASNSALVASLRRCGVRFESRSTVESDHERRELSLVVQERYFDELDATVCSMSKNAPGVLQLAKRNERWRWFRTSEQANIFRESLLAYYDVPRFRSHLKKSIVILRRDEDRHFDELHVAGKIGEWVQPLPFEVHVHTFDNIRGSKGANPPTHQQQLAIIHNTSILIAAHGAGLALIAAMRPGSVVIELFPHNFRYHMYLELAQLMEVKYIPFESPVVWPRGCCSARDMPAADLPSKLNGIRARACKKCDVLVTEDEWSTMLRTAIAHVLSSN